MDDEDCIGSLSRELSFKLQRVHLESQLKILEMLQGPSDTCLPYLAGTCPLIIVIKPNKTSKNKSTTKYAQSALFWWILHYSTSV